MKRIGFLFLSVLLLLSCRNPLQTVNKGPASGTVTIAAALGGVNASRTVVPDFTSAVDEIDVTLTSNDGFGTLSATVASAPWSHTFSPVDIGSWNIDVVAKKAGVQVGAGSAANQQLTSTAALVVSIPITFTSAAPTGDVSFTITFPQSTGIDYLEGLIVETAANQQPAISPSAGTDTAVFSFSALPAGTYSLVMTFKRGGSTGTVAGVFREKLIVWNGYASNAWVDSTGALVSQRAFGAQEFYDNNASLSGLTVPGVLPGASFSSLTTLYAIGAIPNLSPVTFTADSSLPGQYIQYTWNGGSLTEIAPSVQSPSLALAEDNSLVVQVTAPDKQTTNQYTVTFSKGYLLSFDGNGSTGGTVPIDSTPHTVGASISVPGNTGGLTRTGYTFTGWNTAANGSGTSYVSGNTFTMPSSNSTLYAQWSVNGYTVTFDSQGGSAVSPITAAYGSVVTLPAAPTQTGYAFGGWNTAANGSGTNYAAGANFTIPAGNITLYAQWSTVFGTITFDSQGGSAVNPMTGAAGSVVVLPNAPTRTGYTFTGWNTAQDGSGTTYAAGGNFTLPTGSVTLWAQWLAVVYSITYNLNGGTNSPSNPASYTIQSATITFVAPTRTGYAFGGWFTDSGFTASITQIPSGSTGNVTVYAQWTPQNGISVTIDLPTPGSIVFVGTLTVQQGTSLTATVSPAYASYSWYLDGDPVSGTGQSMTLDTTSMSIGVHQLSVIATDASGTQSSGTCTIVVTN